MKILHLELYRPPVVRTQKAEDEMREEIRRDNKRKIRDVKRLLR